jgi:glycosyltransferase involved in cell wall biosynthesis
MQLLMIGFDQTMLAEGESKPSDTRERHIKYAKALRTYYPNGNIVVILRVPPSWSSQQIRIGEGLTVIPVPSARTTFMLRTFIILRELLRNQSFDVVTTQTPFDDGVIGVWLKRKFGVRLNVQMRSSFLDLPYWIKERPFVYRLLNGLGKWVAQQADTLRVVSNGEKERLEKQYPGWMGKIVSLHPLVNTQIFDQSIRDEEAQQVQQVLSSRGWAGAPFLLFVGRLVDQKNLPTLFKAFSLVMQEMPQTVLVIAGDGPLRERLQHRAEQLGIFERIIWLGSLSLQSLRAWYAAACTTVLPSYHEGFGKVVVESYLLGTPVIAAPFVSAQELIRDGETGFIAPEFSDYQWFADHSLELLRNPGRAAEMGIDGRRQLQNYLLPERQYLETLIDIWRVTAATNHRDSKEVMI